MKANRFLHDAAGLSVGRIEGVQSFAKVLGTLSLLLERIIGRLAFMVNHNVIFVTFTSFYFPEVVCYFKISPL